MEKKCLKCGAAIPDGAKFCMGCGSALPDERLCEKCGALVPEGAQFCAECGAAIGSSSPTAAPAPVPVASAAVPRVLFTRDWFIVHRRQTVIAAIALVVLVIAAFILFPPTQDALSGWWDAVADAPKSGVAHIMRSEPPLYMLLKSNRHGYVSTREPVFGEMDMDKYGTHIQYEISGRTITFYSDDNQKEVGTIWGNTIWAFNKKFVKQGN